MPHGALNSHVYCIKKNRNDLFYKKWDTEYRNGVNCQNMDQKIITKLLIRKEKAWNKSRQAANEFVKYNRKAKIDFFSHCK